jgi:uncharacterized delta-60 repeat protein
VTFSGDGQQTTNFGGFGDDRATAVAVTPHGKVIAVGHAGGGTGGSHFALARFNPGGSLDPSFSGDGRQTTGSGGQATGVALQGDGKIVAVGYGVGLARYNPDGSLDMGFAGDGTQATAFVPNAVALTPLGRIVVAGYVGPGPSQTNDFVLARYLGA